MASIYDNQIKNRNFLSPTGFKFILNKAPKDSFFGKCLGVFGQIFGLMGKLI